jgi:pilus assembly protein CpaC
MEAVMGGGRGRWITGMLAAAALAAGCSPRTHAGPEVAAAEPRAADPASAPADAPPSPARRKVPPQAFPQKSTRTTRLITNFDGALDVPTGQSIVLELSAPAERVAIADPEVAEVILISPREVLINGKGRKTQVTYSNEFTGDKTTEEVVQEAKTSVIVWDKRGRSDVRTLYINRARTEQIALEVTVADLNRTAIEAAGFDFAFLQGEVFLSGMNAKLFSFKDGEFNVIHNAKPPVTSVGQQMVLPSNLTYLLYSPNDNFLAFAELLQRENMAKILARPTVIARSGEEAHFRVGGEVPVVYATNNVATVNFKEFGVLLTVTPTLLDEQTIDLRVSTEVSQPTEAFRTTTLGGFSIPAFVSRKASTRVRLKELESLLIGGLMREDENELEDKTPYLGDLPYLGALFRHTRFERTRNELVIVVKPRIARSAADYAPPEHLPTDRGPLTRGEVRTQPDPHGVTRPRLPLTVPAGPPGWEGEAGAPGEPGAPEPLPPPDDAPVPPHP